MDSSDAEDSKDNRIGLVVVTTLIVLFIIMLTIGLHHTEIMEDESGIGTLTPREFDSINLAGRVLMKATAKGSVAMKITGCPKLVEFYCFPNLTYQFNGLQQPADEFSVNDSIFKPSGSDSLYLVRPPATYAWELSGHSRGK